METHEGEGSFKLIRSFLGTIAGGLSSLASLPFGKRKKPEDPLLLDASPHSGTGLDQSGDEFSKLYPDMELSETRKRARFSLDEPFERRVEYSNAKEDNCLNGNWLGESSKLGFERASIQLDDVQHGADEHLDDVHVTAFSSDGVSHTSHDQIETQCNPNASVVNGVSGLDEALLNTGEDSDDFLASFQRTVVARKAKQQKRVQDLLKEESPRKKVRFGQSKLGDNELSESPQGQGKDSMLQKGSSSAKRKRVDVAEVKNEKKMRALTLSEEPVRPEGRTSTVDMASTLTRKRGRVDDDNALVKTATEEVKLQKERANKRSKSIGGTDNRQSARIVYREEVFSRAALALNKEFKGSRLHVSVAHALEVPKEVVSAPVNDSWSIFVSNTPTQVKDEELYDMFSVVGSLKLDVTGVRVNRDVHTGLSKGTAYIFFKTEADVSRLLSSRHTFKLRGRVLRLSRALASNQAEQRPKQSWSTKRSIISETDDSISSKKRAKISSPNESKLAMEEVGQEGEQILTRSRRGGIESAKEHIDVVVSSPHVYATRRVAASLDAHKSSEDSPEAKRKRVEKRQRGISRSKKIRKT